MSAINCFTQSNILKNFNNKIDFTHNIVLSHKILIFKFRHYHCSRSDN